jgi:hypothetical protein
MNNTAPHTTTLEEPKRFVPVAVPRLHLDRAEQRPPPPPTPLPAPRPPRSFRLSPEVRERLERSLTAGLAAALATSPIAVGYAVVFGPLANPIVAVTLALPTLASLLWGATSEL